jgi:hypothetical protein
VSGDRASTLNLARQLDRGLPSPGLPGQLSNFTAATGGLGGTISPIQVSGATPNLAGNTRIATQIFGGVVPGGQQQSALGIPLPASAVPGLQGRVLSPSGLVTQVGQTIAGSFGLTGVAKQVATDIIGIATTKINRTGIIGSGIGVGVTVPYNPTATPTQSQSYIEQRNSQNVFNPTAIPTTGIAKGLDQSTLAAVGGLSSADKANLINEAGNKVKSVLQGSGVDTAGIARAFGINQSQVSGLSPNIQSKIVGQLNSIGIAVPADTNISQVASQGVNLGSFTKEQLANLPPTVPYLTAPNPVPDQSYINSITSRGGPTALARAFGVNSVNEIPQDQLPSQNINTAISGGPVQFQNPLRTTTLEPNLVDTVASAAKYLTSNASIAGLTGLLGSKEGDLLRLANRYPGSPVNINVGGGAPNVINKFGSKTSGKSPLDKIMLR